MPQDAGDEHRGNHGRFYWLLILPAVLMMVGFCVYPLVKVLWITVTEPQPGMQNFERLFTSESVQRVLWVTSSVPAGCRRRSARPGARKA